MSVREPWRTLLEIETELRAFACRDGGCVVLRPRGLVTNGGCHCVRRMLDSPNPRGVLQRVLHLQQERAEAMRREA